MRIHNWAYGAKSDDYLCLPSAEAVKEGFCPGCFMRITDGYLQSVNLETVPVALLYGKEPQARLLSVLDYLAEMEQWRRTMGAGENSGEN